MNITLTREILKLGIEWVKASDEYTKTLLEKLHNPSESTVIAYKIAKEKFELVDEALARAAERDVNLIREAKERGDTDGRR